MQTQSACTSRTSTLFWRPTKRPPRRWASFASTAALTAATTWAGLATSVASPTSKCAPSATPKTTPHAWSRASTSGAPRWQASASCTPSASFRLFGGATRATLLPTERPKNQSESAYAKWTPSVKTDEETLSVINHPMVQQFVEGKKATKARGTYLPPLLEALADTGRLVSRPNVLVRSGRTSWTGPNLQNPPRKGRFRECFVAPTGCVMASIDYSTLELATLAQVCLILFGESRMAALINDGTDLHAWFGARLLGVSYEDMMQRLGTGDPQAKAVRQVAKIPNFGLPGGLGPKGLVEYAAKFGVFLELDQEVTIDGAQVPSARDLCREWKKAFPEMRSYFAMISHESDLSASGRFSVKQLGSGRVRGGATYTARRQHLLSGTGR